MFGTEFVNEIQQKNRVFGMKCVQEFGTNSDNSFSKVEQRNLTGDRNEYVWKFVMTKTGRS